MTFRIVGARPVPADLGFLTAEWVEVEGPDGLGFSRVVIRHPGAAAIVLLDGSEVVLVRQYRAPVAVALLEIPAGKLDPGEDPAGAARREAIEETGHDPGSVRHLASLHTGPGFTDEIIHLFLGTDLRVATAAPEGPEEHSAEVVRLPLMEAIDLIDQGQITDSKTVSGLLLAREVRT